MKAVRSFQTRVTVYRRHGVHFPEDLKSSAKPLQEPEISHSAHMFINAKFNLEQATKAQRGSRGIALLFL